MSERGCVLTRGDRVCERKSVGGESVYGRERVCESLCKS